MPGEAQADTLKDGDEDEKGPSTGGFTRRPQLVLAFECDRPTAGAARYDLGEIDEVVIGRGAERGARRDEDGGRRRLRVTVPGGWMSANHARLSRDGESWTLEDLGSTNGSFVNGKRVSSKAILDADVLELGHTIFLLRSAMLVPLAGPADEDLDPAKAAHPSLLTLVPSYAAKLDGLSRLAPATISLLLLGDTGTGKEVMARAIHALSGRTGSFVPVNCGALPDALVEGQLFGHVKGAFSGALRDEPGLVRASHGGTLFLDEVGDLRKESQAALLRVLQEREVLPVGGTRPLAVDLRVLAATHRPLKDLVAKGQFRADLFARLAGFVTMLPPVRQRQEDIGLLVAALLRGMPRVSIERFSPEVGRAFFLYPWPLNVREIQQCLTSAALLSTRGVVEKEHLPDSIASILTPEEKAGPVAGARAREALDEADERILEELTSQLAAHRGNVAGAARAMGKAPMQLHRWMRKFGIDPNKYRRKS
jgi:DNA-binding NtrC family response regulator